MWNKVLYVSLFIYWFDRSSLFIYPFDRSPTNLLFALIQQCRVCLTKYIRYNQFNIYIVAVNAYKYTH